MSTTYRVDGMSCEHCVRAVRDELGELGTVEQVDVDLDGGRVTVSGTAEDAAIREAIAEAGYEVKGTE